MNATEIASKAIGAAIDDLNHQRSAAEQLAPSTETALTGPGTQLDSLGLITFIVAVEQKIEELSERFVSLTDLAVDMTDDSPLKTVGSLTTYLTSQLGDIAND